jgi:hypothetical protein
VQRRACQVEVTNGAPLILSTRDVPLAPNALTIDVEPFLTLGDIGFDVGQVVALGASAPTGHDADWRVALGGALLWEPRPQVHCVDPRELADRWQTTRATVVAEGAEGSLLPLLWVLESGVPGFESEFARVAGPPARLLCDAAIRGDAADLARAARGLAGLGLGLTPSGDDLLGGFVAAWILVGEALDRDPATRARVTAAVLAGAARGASPLGRAWLEHASRGELLEPMTGFVAALLSPTPGDLVAAARGALGVGASSGTDWMAGFLLAARTMLDRTPSRPTW